MSQLPVPMPVPVQEQNTNDADTTADQIIIIPNPEENPSPPQQQDPIEYSIFKKRMPFDLLSLIFALFVAVGGIIGYALKGSVTSIATGLIFAAIIFLGTYIEAKYKNHFLLMAASATLFSVMGYRWLSSSKFMPAGPVTLISLFMLLRYIYFSKIRTDAKKKSVGPVE